MRIQIGAIVLLFLALTGTAQAAPGGCTGAASLTPFADEAITVSNSSVGFTTATWAPTGGQFAIMAVCTVETDSVRFRATGLAPTNAVGQLLIVTATAPQTITVCGQLTMQRFRMIRVTTDASAYCTYYRESN